MYSRFSFKATIIQCFANKQIPVIILQITRASDNAASTNRFALHQQYWGLNSRFRLLRQHVKAFVDAGLPVYLLQGTVEMLQLVWLFLKKGNYFLGQYILKMPTLFCPFGGGFHDILPHLQLSLHGSGFQQTVLDSYPCQLREIVFNSRHLLRSLR